MRKWIHRWFLVLHRLKAHFFAAVWVGAMAALLPIQSAAQSASDDAPEDPGRRQTDRAAAYIASDNIDAALTVLRALEKAPPAHAGAWLDIGLLYCEAGQGEDAERVFQLLEERYAPPPGIAQLIALYRQSGCAAKVQAKTFKLNLTLWGGHSSNVNSGPSNSVVKLADSAPARELVLLPSSLQRADQFVGLDMLAERALPTLSGAYLTGGARAREYVHESDFSYRQLSVGLGYRKPLGERYLEVLGDVSHLWLGDRPYESAYNLQASTWMAPHSVSGMPLRWGAEALFSSLHYPGNSSFDARTTEVKLKSQLKIRSNAVLTVFAGLTRDLSTNGRLGGDRSGHMTGLGVDLGITERQRLSLYAQRYSLHESQAYNQVLFGQIIRAPKSSLLSVRYQFQLAPKQSFYLQWSQNWRDDKIDLFSMHSRQIMSGYQWNY